MSGDLSTIEKSIEEILIDLMAEKVMFVGVHASSKGGLQASPSTARRSSRSGPSRTVIEKRSKHRDDLANAKLIPSIFLDYIPPLGCAVSRDIIPRDFEYTLITSYLPKGIHTVGTQLGMIPDLKINDFNLGDRKNYALLAPHKYLKKTTGKKPEIVPQPWTKEIARSTILNVMKLPHFDRHRKVNVCVKILLSCYHGGYLWLDRHVIVDPALIHMITRLSMQGLEPHKFYLGKVAYHTLVQRIKDTYDDVEKGKQGYKVASIQDGTVCLACPVDRW
jgi:hypothetical protein